MLIIPVIDLHAGKVVHAVAGQRESYQNIQTPLCHGSDPVNVVDALLGLYPFTTLYVADLDAIKEKANNNEVIDELLEVNPKLCIWLDAGKSVYSTSLPKTRFRRITGSETGISELDLLENKSRSDEILSLDFSADEFIGCQSLLNSTHAWPDDIIIMSLNRVGSHQGPDTSRLAQIQTRAGNKRFYVAGGIRDEDDLQDLHTRNVSGVLLATALHEGKIDTQTLGKYSSRIRCNIKQYNNKLTIV